MHIFSIALVITLLAASSFTQAASQKEVNIYSSRKEPFIRPLLNAFEKETGIKVNLVSGEDDVLIERLKTESQNSPADILITADAGRLNRAMKLNLLQPVQDKELEKQVPKVLRDQNGHWFAMTQRARIIAYAPDRIDTKNLSGYESLAEPLFKGRLCARSSSNVYNQSLTAAMIAHLGEIATENWLKGMVDNFARPPQGGDRDQVKDIAAGKCDLALVNTYYIATMMQSNDPSEQKAAQAVKVFWPNQNDRGAHMNISGAGVTRHAKHKTEAIQLLQFLVKDESQKWYAETNHEYPIRANIARSALLAEWGNFKAETLPMSQLGELNQAAVILMDKVRWK